jgi:uncharacterized protein (TIGR03000 family)
MQGQWLRGLSKQSLWVLYVLCGSNKKVGAHSRQFLAYEMKRAINFRKEKPMRCLVLSAVMGFAILGIGLERASAESLVSAPATIRVTLPADAKLTIDGQPTRSTTAERLFITPPLEGGSSFAYRLRAEFVRDGRTIAVQQKIAVQPGRQAVVALDVPGSPMYSSSESAGTRSYSSDNAISASTATRAAAVPNGPAYRMVESARSLDRATTPGFRPNHWGTDPGDPFYHNQQ